MDDITLSGRGRAIGCAICDATGFIPALCAIGRHRAVGAFEPCGCNPEARTHLEGDLLYVERDEDGEVAWVACRTCISMLD